MKYLPLALLCGLAPALAFAQQPIDIDTLEVVLPEIEIEAVRASETEATAPFALSVMTRSPEEVALTPGTSLEEVLEGLPGVWVNNRNHDALGERLSIRGMGARAQFGVRGVQVLLDGIPLTMPDGQAILDVADPAFVRQAELVRGPASLFWGNGSGGVLFLSTDEAGRRGVRARVLGGSYGLRQIAAEASGSAGGHRFSGFVSNRAQEGYRAHSAGRFTRGALHGDFDLGPRTRLSLTAAAALQDAENPGQLTREQVQENPRAANTRSVEQETGKESQQVQLGATALRQTSVGVLSATAYGLVRDLDNPIPFDYIQLFRRASGLRLSFQNEDAWPAWGVGADVGGMWDDRDRWGNEGGERGERLQDQQEEVTNASAFAYVAPAWGPLRLRLGARADRVRFALDDDLRLGGVDASGDRTFSAVSPAVGLSYALSNALLFASYSTAFETPTTTEIVNRPDGTGFNPDVDPQRTRGFEVGTRGRLPGARLDFDVALFYLNVQGRLIPYELEEDGPTYYRSAGRSTHRGLEAAASWRFRPALTLQLTYTAGQFTFEDEGLEGNRLPGVPDQRFYAHLQGERRGFWGRVAAEAVGAYFTDDANEARNDGYALLDVHVGHEGIALGAARLQPFAEVDNLLDARYNGSVIVNAFGGRFFEPAPGRTFRAGLNVRL